MNIHEYQAKKILSQYGISVPKGMVAYTAAEARRAAGLVGRGPWMVKAQVYSGARDKGRFAEKTAGKKGGIRKASTRRDAFKEAAAMLGATLVTAQTDDKGKAVSRVYVEAFSEVKKIFYMGMVIDRSRPAIMLLAAETGDKDILSVRPSSILKVPLDVGAGADGEQIAKVMNFLKLGEKSRASMEAFVNGLARAFVENDATMIEINPAGMTKGGAIVALDAKMSFDENALGRHKEILRLRDEAEYEARELKAAKYGFRYDELDGGNIGCIVNGDGTGLACMDLLAAHGAEMACLLNVKGGVDKDKIAAGIKIIMTNPKVEGILIYILGGFLRCNLIAEGIVSAASEVGLNVPLVVRFEGTNKDEGKEILAGSRLPLIIAESMEESVRRLLEVMEAAD